MHCFCAASMNFCLKLDNSETALSASLLTLECNGIQLHQNAKIRKILKDFFSVWSYDICKIRDTDCSYASYYM